MRNRHKKNQEKVIDVGYFGSENWWMLGTMLRHPCQSHPNGCHPVALREGFYGRLVQLRNSSHELFQARSFPDIDLSGVRGWKGRVDRQNMENAWEINGKKRMEYLWAASIGLWYICFVLDCMSSPSRRKQRAPALCSSLPNITESTSERQNATVHGFRRSFPDDPSHLQESVRKESYLKYSLLGICLNC